MDIYQQKWEEAFNGLLKYLYEKAKTDFYMAIDVRKMFKNFEIPRRHELIPLRFYLDQIDRMIFDIRIKLYEMKMNSMCRIKMPITANTEFIDRMKSIYLTHIVIENLMGDKLKYDQYIFFFDKIKFIYDSTAREQLLVIKDKVFMEDALTKHVILQALIWMMKIIENLRERAKYNNEDFSYNNYIQINMPLEATESPAINAHDLTILSLSDEVKKTRELLLREIDDIGRFWIMEGLLNPKDRELWMEAVEALRNINFSVQNDIRDMILTQFDESKKVLSRDRSRDSKDFSSRKSKDDLSKLSSQTSLKHEKHERRSISTKKKPAGQNINKKKQANVKDPKEDKIELSFDTDEESTLKAKQKDRAVNTDLFRPPYCWNFPYEKLKKNNEEERVELRINDPRSFYRDGRVEKFLDMLNEIKKRMIDYKGSLWNYIIGKTLPIFASMNNQNILPKNI